MDDGSGIRVRYSAELYDSFTKAFVAPFDDILIKRVRDEYGAPGRTARLVDIGTGTAQVLIKLANRPEFDALELIGMDYFLDMVEEARAAVARHGLTERVKIVAADVHHLPCADRRADLIISRSTIHHWPDPAAAFREIHRILAPGGVAIIHDVRRDPNPEALAEFNRMRAQAGVENSLLDGKFTPAEVHAFLTQAGLDETTARIFAPEEGMAALGFEVRITGPAAT